MSSATATKIDLWVDQGLVSFSSIPSAQTPALNLDGYMILPGLINAHDHLELNLFPRLGCGPYPNALAWAQDIYRPNEPPVKEHLAVPKTVRLQWGAIKNLLSGVTTVAHHNAFHPVFLEPDFPVRVVRRYGWAHSLRFSPDWESRFRSTPANYPFVIHAAEGTDALARRELKILAQAGALTGSTVLVHGVAVTPSDVPLLSRTKTSIVWCPTSNHFTLNGCLDPAVLESVIPIALGTDSALTSEGDLLDELRVARRIINAQRLYRMVTSEPARMFKLPAAYGQICHRGPADFWVVEDAGERPATALLENHPQLVVVRGRVQLVSIAFARFLPPGLMRSLQPLEIAGRGRYLFAADVSSLLEETKRTLRQDVHLAGKAIAA